MTSLDRTRAIAVAALLAALTACSMLEVEAPKPAPVQAVIQKPGQKVVRVSADNNGASVVLEPSQLLVVSLATSISSGLEWAPVDLKPGVLRVQGSRFDSSMRPIDYEEGTGLTVWQLQAQAPGSVALKFDLRRPHSLDAAMQTVTFNVSVK